MLVKTNASAVFGVDAKTINVEVSTGGSAANGEKMFFLVGLPDSAVREGYQRIEAAIKNIGCRPRILRSSILKCFISCRPLRFAS